jgi:two-component system phosphate regulon sensor histidine kinase PhoR
MKNTTSSQNRVNELSLINEELENYFQSTIIPQLFFDKNLILRKYSPAAVKQFNLTQESIGKHLNDLSNNLYYDTLEEDIRKTMLDIKVVEKEIQASDQKWYRMNILPFFQRKEKTTNGVIITFVDINNYVLSLKELQKLNAEHETFIYSVTHDLKAPVQNIKALVNALKDAIALDNQKDRDHILDMITISSNKIIDMLSDLGKISQARGKHEDNKMIVRFQDLMNEVYLTLKENIDHANAKIDFDFEVGEINFSRKDLRSILYNLLSNAIKYRSEERDLVISINTKREGEFVALSVKDNGRGIEEDKKGVIFSQYTRILNDVEGTGIGLFLVSRIVDSQGGKIIINSKINQGSEFLVYLKP